MKIEILLADHHRLMLQCLRNMLEGERDFSVVGAATNGREAVEMAKAASPHIAIINTALPELNGIEAARRIARESPRTQVIALADHDTHQAVVRMLQAGVSAYVLKESEFKDLAHAIRQVAAGKGFLSPQVTGNIIRDYAEGRHATGAADADPLTSREREVLQLLAEGGTSKQIASTLSISPNTADRHRKNIMAKLDIHNIAELTKYAIRHGITAI